MKTIYILLFLISSLIFTSCEKVIDLKLKDASQKIVVEANIYSGEGNNFVQLTKSGNFYESNDFETINNASIIVTDNSGNSYTFNAISDGLYQNDTLNGIELTEYSLSIKADGKTITSKSVMPKLVPIDSVSVVLEDGGGFGGSGKKFNYRLFCNFKDPVNEENYYRIKVFINGEFYQDINIFDDALFNGKDARMPLRIWVVKPGDIVEVQLISLDRANYEYFRLLAKNGMGAMSTSVGNPVSNVTGDDVIGVFGAYAVDKETVLIK